MGSSGSKQTMNQIVNLEGKLQDLIQDFNSVQNNLNNMPNEFTLKSEADPKIQKLEEESLASSQKLNQLLDVTKDQQQVIMDIGIQYGQLCENYQSQQEAIAAIASKCEDRLSKYEEDLQETRTRLTTLEKEAQDNAELVKTIGIRKTENMIKKQSMSPFAGMRNILNAPKKSIDEKTKPKERSTATRSLKKHEKEVIICASEAYKSKTKENEHSNGQENLPNFLDIIVNEKKELSGSTAKETLTEVDINTL